MITETETDLDLALVYQGIGVSRRHRAAHLMLNESPE
jgi:hypothetical protein